MGGSVRVRHAAALPAIVLVGFSATWAVTFALAYTFAFTPPSILGSLQVNASRVLYFLAIALAQLAIALAARKLVLHAFRVPLAIAATALFLIGVGTCWPAASFGGGWAYAVLFPLAGIWQGVFHVLWAESAMGFSFGDGYRIVCGSVSVGALAFLAVMVLAADAAPIVMAMFAVAAMVLYLFGLDRAELGSSNANMMPGRLARDLRKSTVTLLAYGAVFGASIYACMSSGFGLSGGEDAAIGAAIFCGADALLFASVFAGKMLGLDEVVSAVSPILVLVLLAQAYFGQDASWVAYPLLLGTLTAFDSIAFSFQLRITRELDLCPLFCIARGRFFVQFGMFLAALACFLLASQAVGRSADVVLVPLALVALLFIVSAVTSKVDFAPQPSAGSRDTGERGMPGGTARPMSRPDRVDIEARIADDFGLSARELDILRLLVSGYTMAGIAEKLVISQNTVKSHFYHMYRKLGVNSKKEVIDIRDQYEERYRAG